MAEATQTEAPQRAPVTVVTQENYEAYVNETLAKEKAARAPTGNDGPEGAHGSDTVAGALNEKDTVSHGDAAANASPAEPKELDKRVNNGNKEVFYKGKWVDEGNFGYRLHLKNEEFRKEFEPKLSEAEKKAKEAADRAAQLEAERDALRQKYEPVKNTGPGAEPQRAQFVNDEEYVKALRHWGVEQGKWEAQQAIVQEARVKTWEANKAKVREEFPNWDKTVGESSVVVNDQLRDAIYDSDHGPRLLLHLAEHPEVAKSLNSMAPGRMQREIGRLEASFANKATPAAPAANPVAEISKAPAPITPIRGEGTEPVTNLRGSDKVPQNWTFEDYKKARREGRIK